MTRYGTPHLATHFRRLDTVGSELFQLNDEYVGEASLAATVSLREIVAGRT